MPQEVFLAPVMLRKKLKDMHNERRESKELD